MKSLSDLQTLDKNKLITFIKTSVSKSGSIHLEIGKAVFVLDALRDSGTLKKFVRAITGTEIPDHAFCCANSFALVGEGYSFIPESDYDNTPLRWHLQVSAILNLIAELSEEEKAAVREEVCAILRARPTDGYDTLKAIKARLKPAPENDDKGEGKESEEKAENVLPFVDYLSPEHWKALGTAAHACDDEAKLTLASRALEAIASIITNKLDVIKDSRAVAA